MERRAEARVTASYDVDVKTVDGYAESTVSGNISVNGLCFVTADPGRYSIGQHVDLWIGLPGQSGEGEGVTTEGTITWKSDDDISTCGELIRPHVGVSLLQPLVLPVVD